MPAKNRFDGKVVATGARRAGFHGSATVYLVPWAAHHDSSANHHSKSAVHAAWSDVFAFANGSAQGTGFDRRGRESLWLTLVGRSERVSITAEGGVAPGFISP